MGEIREAQPVKLVSAIFSGREEVLTEAHAELVAMFGPVDMESTAFDFDQTTYYEEQMGPDLKKTLLAFERLIKPDDLPGIKRATNKLEETLAGRHPDGAPRPVNIDPGYVSLSKLVLATTKDYSHRLYLGEGIYGEVTLAFQGGGFEPQPWTYPDYRREEYRAFLTAVRNRLKSQLMA